MSPKASSDATDAALSLRQCLRILSRRRWTLIGIWSLTALAAVLYALLATPVYEGSALVELAKPGSTEPLKEGGVVNVGDDDQYFQTEFHRFTTDSLDAAVYGRLQLERVPDFAPPRGLEKLQKAIRVAPVPRTHLVYVKVRAHDPRVASQIANQLASEYVQGHVNDALFMSRYLLKTLHLDSPRGDPRAVYDSLPAVVENRLIQAAKEQRISLEGQLADLSRSYTPQHPLVVAANARLAALNKTIERETQNVVDSLKAQLAGRYVPNNVRVLDAARVPERPVKPNKALVALLGLVAGLVLGLFGVAAAESVDESIRGEEDVEHKVQEAFLGVVPRARQKSGLKALTDGPTLTTEAFRNLRTMVDVSSDDGRATPMLVTSSVHKEGKSLVAANLAVAFSNAGERVLLIEGDLRRPSLHARFGLPADQALCDYLAGGTQGDLSRLTRSVGIPNLSVLLCGERPPNPSELLNTPRMADLIEWARRSYDRVIVDCTPLFPVNDTLLWGRAVRSALFVTRFAKTDAPLARSACTRLRTGGIKPLGVVINATRLMPHSAGYFRK
jgi:tyrosine-protein kinase Etk/Wzc